MDWKEEEHDGWRIMPGKKGRGTFIQRSSLEERESEKKLLLVLMGLSHHVASGRQAGLINLWNFFNHLQVGSSLDTIPAI